MTKRGKRYDIPVETAEEYTDEADRSPEDAPAAPEPEAPEADLSTNLDHLRRLQAEFANYRKRVERERMETVAWAQGTLVEKILPVLDDFDRAAASLEGDASPAAEGLHMIREKLMNVLKEAGLERIEAMGSRFDPEIHEALMTQPVEAERADSVLDVFEPGFQFKGRLIRPARVQVGVESDDS